MKEHFLTNLVKVLTDGKSHTVRIYGHGASGKTTLARDLLALLPPDQVNLIETDAYIIDGRLRQEVRPAAAPDQKVTAFMPVSHELASLTRDVQALQKGMDLLTIDCSPWAPQTVLSGKKPILIVEGMSSAFLDKELFDTSIACYTDPETELARRLVRDVAERGGVAEAIKAGEAVRQRQYEIYYKDFLDQADILINQSGDKFVVEKMTID